MENKSVKLLLAITPSMDKRITKDSKLSSDGSRSDWIRSAINEKLQRNEEQYAIRKRLARMANENVARRSA